MCWCGCLFDCFLVIISVLFPPLPVWIRRGFCSADSWINILLCFLGYLPGLIHSWYIIAKYPPYSQGDTKIYYIYRNDIENQTPHRHEHHYHHTHNTSIHSDQSQPLRSQPSAVHSPSYGAVHEGTSRNSAAPPAYEEIDHKVQR
ncbi:uncharacterized protein CANTADRAFT_4345 [Suhomyces tanzawaensis NRRL Y-17324]|uniref:Uncharacterized protein n=1 Tax=Suhomyces tanzawaensis NRRL Y-17324 TaxID=984487 RepID=A0A1E4SSE5_9ASCO|nr:uncharacterized protein CANTADRAFT_4345 [Suhomyces tanzawaensis NRRL Y-17324]ODV82337.1 hypothetical protein CANTADRAFT_4345 [Suhomyces tanzawaensis NRRL Y-17324]